MNFSQPLVAIALLLASLGTGSYVLIDEQNSKIEHEEFGMHVEPGRIQHQIGGQSGCFGEFTSLFSETPLSLSVKGSLNLILSKATIPTTLSIETKFNNSGEMIESTSTVTGNSVAITLSTLGTTEMKVHLFGNVESRPFDRYITLPGPLILKKKVDKSWSLTYLPLSTASREGSFLTTIANTLATKLALSSNTKGCRGHQSSLDLSPITQFLTGQPQP